MSKAYAAFSAVALVFTAAHAEEGEIKEILSLLREEIEKVENREVA